MDAPLQRMLRIGKISVGLIGLDIALNRVLQNPDLDLASAVTRVYGEIAEKNYIPANALPAYQEAIGLEIRRLRGEVQGSTQDSVIRILGTGCVSCNNLQKLMIEIMADLRIAADVVQVHDPDEFARFGVLLTPALLMNGEVKCAGRLPSRAQIEEWLREEAGA